MKIAVLGATGGLGYHFARSLLHQTRHRLTVYTTGTTNLSNLARHSIDLRLTPYRALHDLRLDRDVDVLVNFAHPFGARDTLSSTTQLEILGDFLLRALRTSPRLSMIHVSSMSVYEPFEPGRACSEIEPLKPPRRDAYARAKWRIETVLAADRSSAERLLVLRPTVVYGPFCRPWTDNLLGDLRAGDVPYCSLEGRIQPLFIEDLTRVLLARVECFSAGVMNVAGPDAMPWEQFLRFFESVVGVGRLVRIVAASRGTSGGLLDEVRGLTSRLSADSELRTLAANAVRRLPTSIEGWARRRAATPDYRNLRRTERGGKECKFCDIEFFGRDRLVSVERQREAGFLDGLTKLADTRSTLDRYHRFRFTDEVMA